MDESVVRSPSIDIMNGEAELVGILEGTPPSSSFFLHFTHLGLNDSSIHFNDEVKDCPLPIRISLDQLNIGNCSCHFVFYIHHHSLRDMFAMCEH